MGTPWARRVTTNFLNTSSKEGKSSSIIPLYFHIIIFLIMVCFGLITIHIGATVTRECILTMAGGMVTHFMDGITIVLSIMLFRIEINTAGRFHIIEVQ